MKSITQWLCRHHYFQQFEADRLYLKCVNCKHETPGWDVTPRGHAVTERAVDQVMARAS